MKIELESADIDQIAQSVCDVLLPKLSTLLDSLREEDELLSIEQAAEVLQRSKKQLYQWVHSTTHGLLDFPFSKQGKQLRFSKKKLLQWTTHYDAHKKPVIKNLFG